MNEILRKLQFRDQPRICVSGAPTEFRPVLDAMRGVAAVTSRPARGKETFALFFVRSRADVVRMAPVAADALATDGVLWFAYPKRASKRYSTDLGRDDGWQPIWALGFEGVRQVAIDADWSALRWRHVDHIKTLTRDPKRAMTPRGKARARKA